MFDVSFWEVLLVAIIALLVIGPEKLPRVAAEVGKWFGRAQRFIRNARVELEREFHNYEIKEALEKQKKHLEEVKKIAAEAGSDLKHKLEDIAADQEINDPENTDSNIDTKQHERK